MHIKTIHNKEEKVFIQLKNVIWNIYNEFLKHIDKLNQNNFFLIYTFIIKI